METTHALAQVKGRAPSSTKRRTSTLPTEKRMGENGRERPTLPPVVTMNWCRTCATPLPSDWETCPGCDLYSSAMEALDDYDSSRAAAERVTFDPARIGATAEAGVDLSMRFREALSELRLRRTVLGRAMRDLQDRVRANARNRRRNRGLDADAPATVRVGTRRRPEGGVAHGATAIFPPPPQGWGLLSCPQGRPYYWHFASGRTQWEPPYGVCVGAPSDRPHRDQPGEMRLGSEPDEGQPALPDLGSESSDRPTFRIRFAGAHGMTQVAQAFPMAWEPEPLPQARERDASDGSGQES